MPITDRELVYAPPRSFRQYRQGAIGTLWDPCYGPPGQLPQSPETTARYKRYCAESGGASYNIAQRTSPIPALAALGGDGSVIGTLGVIGVLAVGFFSYQIGKALAPSKKQKTSWGVTAIPVGLLTGPFGLGIMAMVSMEER